MNLLAVRIQQEDFDTGAEISRMRQARSDSGALVAFVGQVRDLSAGATVSTLTLEHYPGMTEKSLQAIVQKALLRWDIHDARVIHRIGELQPNDQIVLVLVAGAHRGEAFAACEFIMDCLKTEAPFWKKEQTDAGERWVDARVADEAARLRWMEKC